MLADVGGGANSLVGLRGWHPDVGNHDGRLVLLDCLEQLVVGLAHCDHVDVVKRSEQRDQALSHEITVLSKHDRHGHDRKLTQGIGAGGGLRSAGRVRRVHNPDLHAEPSDAVVSF